MIASDFGLGYGIGTAGFPGQEGTLTHQIPPRRVTGYLRSLTYSLLSGDNFAADAAFLFAELMVVTGSPVPAAQCDNLTILNWLGTPLTSFGKILYRGHITGPGPQTLHFGDLASGPLVIPPGQTINILIGPGGNATGACNYLVSILADGWWDAQNDYAGVYGPDPSRKVLR